MDMTPRERELCALNLKEPDRVPYYCKPENVLAMAEAVQRYGKYPIMIA
jgi:hypothetical protein